MPASGTAPALTGPATGVVGDGDAVPAAVAMGATATVADGVDAAGLGDDCAGGDGVAFGTVHATSTSAIAAPVRTKIDPTAGPPLAYALAPV